MASDDHSSDSHENKVLFYIRPIQTIGEIEDEIDSLIQHISWMHIITIITVFLSYVNQGFTNALPNYHHSIPSHHCSLSNCVNQTKLTELHPIKSIEFNECNNSTKFVYDYCKITDCHSNFNSCKNYTYGTSSNTVVTEFNLVCDQAFIVPWLTSVYYTAMFIGAIFYGWFSANYGRTRCHQISYILLTVVYLFSANAWNVESYILREQSKTKMSSTCRKIGLLIPLYGLIFIVP